MGKWTILQQRLHEAWLYRYGYRLMPARQQQYIGKLRQRGTPVRVVFFALNVAIIGYYQAIEQNARATVYMLLRGFVFLIPAFVLMPMLVSPQGLWLAVPVSEILTFAVILLSWQRK